jgi:hypothetical protein
VNEVQARQSTVWQKMPFANLVRYVPSGNYFARLRVHGKLIRRCLKTNKIGVAKIRLADLEKVERQRIETHGAIANGTMKFGDALAIFRHRLQGGRVLKATKQGLPVGAHRRVASFLAGVGRDEWAWQRIRWKR